MLNFTTYDLGYPWWIAYGLAIPMAIGLAFLAAGLWRGWPRWVLVPGVLMALWGAAGVLAINVLFGINSPMELPTERFLSSGAGKVLDAGAGSGRAALGVLLARPRAHVTGLDIYDGFWGIEGNTPERFMNNVRIAGAADRADARRGDMREMPFADGQFDAVVSSYAIDHLGRQGTPKALAEVARVLKPGGEFLLLIVNVDWLTWIVSPHAIAHHPRADPARWRGLLETAGFAIEEEGTSMGTRYFMARKQS